MIYLEGGSPSPLSAYIPLIVGIGAVILSIIGNIGLEWWKQHLDAKRKTKILASCLAAELQERFQSANTNAELLKKNNDLLMRFAIVTNFPMYSTNLNEIGLLGPEGAALVIKAYAKLNALLEFSFHYGEVEKQESLLIATFKPENRQKLGDIHQQIADGIRPALDALRRY